MNVRIIAGTFGGRIIEAPGRSSTHAMGERIRNAIFNSLGEDVRGARVLDIFAGSGAIGIEALSRGATHCVFVERDRAAMKIIQKNLEILNTGTKAQAIGKQASSWINQYKGDRFDIIFADPPYHDTQIHTITKLFKLLAPGGRLIVSLPAEQELPAYATIEVVSERIYGNAKIIVTKIRTSQSVE